MATRPPVLLVHGAFSNAGHFAPWSSYFAAAGDATTVPSLPGHDPSDTRVLAASGMPDYLAALRQVFSRFAEPPVVIGHSVGGLLAQQLAAQFSCAALVCLAAAPPWMLPAQARSLPYLAPMMPRILAGLPVRPTKQALDFLVLHDLPASEGANLRGTFGHESGRVYRSVILGTVRVARGAASCPVLCISGELDRVVTPRIGARIARHYDGEHVVLPGKGHWLIAESHQETVAGIVRGWLERALP